MSSPNNPQQPPTQQNPQTIYGYNYYYPSYPYYQYYPYFYSYPAYPSPKYYYEITKYAPPFAPPGKKQNPQILKLAWVLIALLAAVNLVTGGFMLFAAYDENHEHTAILKGTITDANGTMPLADVKITVSGTNLSAHSDTNGSFELPVTTGVHCLVFEKPDYQTINGTVVVGKYLDNQLSVEMQKGNESQNQTLTSFQTIDDYIANLMVSSTLSVFTGGFALIGAFHIRRAKFRSMGIGSGVLGIFSLFILSGISLIFMVPAMISTILGFAILVTMYLSSEMFLSQPVTATGAD
ncbi:MAG: carboxypeptidase-like regulatory domain-containing protein [Thermoplasmata archaeon]|nr:carboxypeptidase-like regulatory domain-containing protein [Thermoplasmata archaeon]